MAPSQPALALCTVLASDLATPVTTSWWRQLALPEPALMLWTVLEVDLEISVATKL